LGGLAIYLGFLGGLFCVVIFDPGFFTIHYSAILGLLIGATLVLILGIYDDFQGSSALLKFTVQIIIALLLVKSGFLLRGITLPGLINIEFGIFSRPITLFWLVGIINAVNLMDGLDGLAAGVIGIIASFIFIFGLILKENFIMYVSLALAGACFAFLKYNFHPAKIFMGDTGSLFLGLVVACLGIYKPDVNSGNPYFIPIAILLFLPVIDTTLAIIRRVIRKRSIFSGDAAHIHHYFIKRGFNQAQITIRFYLATFFLGLISLLLVFYIKS
jgi:UDP-GlcNAc:undecaprenyl-phosphate GlcNAc-1-phosphate transferase